MKVEVPFGQFLPDSADYKNPGLKVCDNVFARGGVYQPIKKLQGTGRRIVGEARGTARIMVAGGESISVIGGVNDLYVYRGRILTPSGLVGVSLPLGDNWSFDVHGNSIYATSESFGLYVLNDFDTDDTFAPLGVVSPKARYLNLIDDFLMTGNMVDIDGSAAPYRLRWSAYNNPRIDWTTDMTRQSGFVDMPARFGEITGLLGNKFDLVFQEGGLSRIWHTGGPTVFAKDEIEEQRGCTAPQSIVSVGSFIYFLADDGFCRTDGAAVEVISSDRVWQWFSDNVNVGFRRTVKGEVDWANRSIIWAFIPRSSDGYQRSLIYNFGLDQWTTGSFLIGDLVAGERSAINVDEDDPAVEGDEILDIDGPSFDSAVYLGQGRSLFAIRDGEICTFTGQNQKATFETGAMQPEAGKRSFVTEVYPLIENTERLVTAEISGRDHLGDKATYTPPAVQGPLNYCPVVSDARFHSVRVSIPSGVTWRNASGIQIEYENSGKA